MAVWKNASRYFEAGLGSQWIAVLGILSFLGTITFLIFNIEEYDKPIQVYAVKNDTTEIEMIDVQLLYISVLVLTIVTGFSAAYDFQSKENKAVVVLTVFSGMLAVFASFLALAIIMVHQHGSYSKAMGLFILQVFSVSLQLGAIFNNNGREAFTEGHYELSDQSQRTTYL